MISRHTTKDRFAHSHSVHPLAIEALEDRVMLSSVDITAYGEVGEETFSLLINGVVVQDYTVGTESQTFSYSSPEADFTADGVRIQFTNDLYLPEQNVDRNLIVDKIAVDGIVFETEAASVFGTGTWTGSGIQPGFNFTETLHTNGYFQYADQLDALGFSWTRSDTTTGADAFEREDGALILTGSSSANSSLWTIVPVEGNILYEFSTEAWRELNAGQIQFDGQPWASVGVDFYDDAGNLLTKEEIQVNGPTEPFGDGAYRVREMFAPEAAAFAGIWAWTQQSSNDVDIPLVIDFVDLYPIISEDTTPPALNLIRSPVNEPTSELQFTVRLDDESGIMLGGTSQLNEIRIDGPNGYSTEINSIAATGNATSLNLFYQLSTPFDSTSNGEYTVTVNGDKFRDTVGNIVEAGTLVGVFLVDIPGIESANG